MSHHLLAVLPSHWDDAVLTTAALAAALVGIGTVVIRVFTVAKRIDAAIGVDDEGQTLSQRVRAATDALESLGGRVDRLEQALTPPGATPLTARVDQLEAHVDALSTRVSTMTDLLRADITDRRRRADET